MSERYKLLVRRQGAEAGINLRKIRRWFDETQDAANEDKGADKSEKPENKGSGSTDKGKGDKGEGKEWTLDSAQREIERLRKESESRRLKLRKYEKAESESNKAKDEDDDAKLLADKNYEKLLAKREQQLKDAADRLKAAEVQTLREKIGRRHELPDEIVELLRGDSEEDIEAHAKKLKPLFTKGEQGNGKKPGSTTTANPGGAPSKRTQDQIRDDIYKRNKGDNPFAR